MKFISWNIDSLNAALTSTSPRSSLSRDVLKTIMEEKPDFIAIQETKLPETGMNEKQSKALLEYFPWYKAEYVSSMPPARKGYAGTMLLFKENLKPVIHTPKIGAPDTMDQEGRIIAAETDKFFLVNVYTPNAGDGLKRLKERQEWDLCFGNYLSELDKIKPVIACGDFNVAHEEIDLANPASNHMSAGFTDEERNGFSTILNRGFVDSFRSINGNITGVYSWWAQRIKTSKINNSGWRIDYFLTSNRLEKEIKRSEMLDSGPRQDHTPIVLEIDL